MLLYTCLNNFPVQYHPQERPGISELETLNSTLRNVGMEAGGQLVLSRRMPCIVCTSLISVVTKTAITQPWI